MASVSTTEPGDLAAVQSLVAMRLKPQHSQIFHRTLQVPSTTLLCPCHLCALVRRLTPLLRGKEAARMGRPAYCLCPDICLSRLYSRPSAWPSRITCKWRCSTSVART